VQRLRQLSGVELVRAVVEADLGTTSPTAAGRSLASASEVTNALARFEWSRVEPLMQAMRGEGSSADEAARVITDLRSALAQEEAVTAIARALKDAEDGAFAWLRKQAPGPGPTPPPPGPAPTPPGIDHGKWKGTVNPASTAHDDILGDLRKFLDQHPHEQVEVSWRVVE